MLSTLPSEYKYGYIPLLPPSVVSCVSVVCEVVTVLLVTCDDDDDGVVTGGSCTVEEVDCTPVMV